MDKWCYVGVMDNLWRSYGIGFMRLRKLAVFHPCAPPKRDARMGHGVYLLLFASRAEVDGLAGFCGLAGGVEDLHDGDVGLERA